MKYHTPSYLSCASFAHLVCAIEEATTSEPNELTELNSSNLERTHWMKLALNGMSEMNGISGMNGMLKKWDMPMRNRMNGMWNNEMNEMRNGMKKTGRTEGMNGN